MANRSLEDHTHRLNICSYFCSFYFFKNHIKLERNQRQKQHDLVILCDFLMLKSFTHHDAPTLFLSSAS